MNDLNPLARVDIESRNGTPLISMHGELDLSNADLLTGAFQKVSRAHGAVILDLSELTFVDSTGLNAIARYGNLLAEAGGSLYLVVTRPALRKIFRVTRLDELFPVSDSLADVPV